MSTCRVYVDSIGIDIPEGSSALDAVRALKPGTAEEIAHGAASITDSRGLPIDPESKVHGGAIYRTIPVRQRDAR